jgi:hypothetical protein
MSRANQLSIEDFARLSAALAAPFADREKVLGAAAIDEESWAKTKTAMTQLIAARLQIDDRGPLDAYRSAFAGTSDPSREPATPTDPSSQVPAAVEQAPADAPKFTPSYMLGKQLRTPAQVAAAAPAAVSPAEPPRVVIRPPVQVASQPASVARAASPAATVLTTMEELSRKMLQAKPATPFTPDDGAAAHAHTSQPFLPSEQSGETKEVGMLSLESLLPFINNAREAPPTPLGWTLARYASFCVDLLRSGAPEAQVLAAAQVTPEQRAELDAYWRQRLRDEPAVRSEWKLHADRREAELRASREG